MEEYQKNTVKNLEQEESILVNIDIDKFLNFITQLQNKIWIINDTNFCIYFFKCKFFKY